VSTRAPGGKALRGEWRCTSVVIDGEKLKLSVASKIRLTLDGENYIEEAQGKELQRLRYTVQPGGVLRFDARPHRACRGGAPVRNQTAPG
jgi:hypothetical protein